MAYRPGVQPGSGKSQITFRRSDGSTTVSRAGSPTVTYAPGEPIPNQNTPEASPDKVTIITPRTGPQTGTSSIYQGLPGQKGPLIASGPSNLPFNSQVTNVQRTSQGYRVNYETTQPKLPTVRPYDGNTYKGPYTSPLVRQGYTYDPITGNVQGPQPTTQNSNNTNLYNGYNVSSNVLLGNDKRLVLIAPRSSSAQETINRAPTQNELLGIPNYTPYPQNVTTTGYKPGVFDAGAESYSRNYSLENFNLNTQALKNFKQGGVKGTVAGTTLGTLAFTFGAGEAIVRTPEFFSPVTYQGRLQYPIVQPFAESANAVVTQPRETVLNQPFTFAGGLAGGVLGGKLATGLVGKGKSVYVATGARYVPPEQVFSPQVLVEGQRFPTSTGTTDALTQFKQGDNILVHSGPSKVSGTTAGAGGAAKAGLEDPGIYGTPKGQASPNFLGIKQNGYGKITLNPFKLVESLFSQPTVTEFKTRGVTTQPPEVLLKPGFSSTAKFFEETGSKTGQAYITKRSMIGQGEVSGAGIPDAKARKGTSEIEAVVPEGAKFAYEPPKKFLGKLKGYEEYTEFEGRNVPIRKANLVGESTPEVNIKLVNLEELKKKGSSYYVESSQSTPVILSPSVLSSPPKSGSSTSSSSSLRGGSARGSSSSRSGRSSVLASPSSGGSSTSFSESASSFSNVETSGGSSLLTGSGSTSTPTNSSTPSNPITPPGSSTPSRPSNPQPIIPPTSSLPLSKGLKETKRKTRFLTKVRSKGKFETKGVFDTLEKAFSKGFSEVKNTAAASFKVEEQGRGTVQLPALGQFSDQIYKSKKEKGVLIQRREKRISTRGEKEQITFKGIQANKLRSGFNKSNMGGLRL